MKIIHILALLILVISDAAVSEKLRTDSELNLLRLETANLVNLISHGYGKFDPSDLKVEFIEINKWKYAVVFFRFDFGAVDSDSHFLALFEFEGNSPKKFALTAFKDLNSNMRRMEIFSSLGGNRFEISGYHYLDNDSNCCPSESVKVVYSVEREDFKEETVVFKKLDRDFKNR